MSGYHTVKYGEIHRKDTKNIWIRYVKAKKALLKPSLSHHTTIEMSVRDRLKERMHLLEWDLAPIDANA